MGKRKGFPQGEQIEQYAEKIRALEKENKVLTRENASLVKVNGVYQKSVEELEGKYAEVETKYLAGLREIEKLKSQFEDLMASATTARDAYEHEIQGLLERLRRHVES